MSESTLVHLSDLHFGRPVDLPQIRAVERLVPELAPDAVVVAGDISQRGRHGEYQRGLAFLERMQETAPTLLVPGNHDVEWWKSPFGIFGRRVLYAKYRQYFGEDLTPVLRLPGLVVAGALSAHGLAVGSMTWNQRDLTVKGHLPKSETDRLAALFAAEPPDTVRVAVLHHNVLRGDISQRMGLAHWASAQRRLDATGAHVVLCGHDHQEGAGQLPRGTVISTSSTLSDRTRGKRPSVFNVVRVGPDAVKVEFWRWDLTANEFRASDSHAFARSGERHGVVGAGRVA
ncbi:MAG TPA: metallophosphoesterase [Gemmatimonadales bacterium]|nr:metallophosphoesterase [Gemmatimonadales bacterium]HRZ09262.1 metallophosphoesterase [Gemmatimonadales bacterium]